MKNTKIKNKKAFLLILSLLMTAIVGFFVIPNTITLFTNSVDWPFDTPANYTYDSSKIDISGGIVKVKTVDQTDDDNTADGFAGGIHNETQWDAGNSWLELTAVGQTNGSGDFVSRIINAGASVAWNTFSWIPERPLYKELPDNAGTESAYAEGNADMSGNVLLLHMNESSGSIIDTSGNGNNGTNTGADYSATGIFNTALNFDGTDDVTIPNSASLNISGNEVTVEAWIKWNVDPATWSGLNPNNEGASIISKGGTREWILKHRNDNTRFQFITKTTSGNVAVASSTQPQQGVWYHVVGVYDGSDTHIYINGALDDRVPKSQTGNLNVSDKDVIIGKGRIANRYFNGIIDEVAIYDRALSASEILDHYKRGALRLKYQVRSCDDAACDTEQFIGPDGTNTTYYSEVTDNTTDLPSKTLTNITDNQYFQYKAFLETDDNSYSPEIKSVVVGPQYYHSDSPTIVNTTGQAYTFLDSFSETLGGANAGSVKYQLSNDGTNFFYHDGSNWVVAANDFAQTNTAAEINTNIANFSTSYNNLYFKAFLKSDGTQQVELDQISAGHTPPEIQFSLSESLSNEGDGTASVELNLAQVITADATVDYDIVGGTAGNGVDYNLASGTATIPAGSLTTNITVEVLEDTTREESESLIIQITNPQNAGLGVNDTHIVYIVDNEPLPGGIGNVYTQRREHAQQEEEAQTSEQTEDQTESLAETPSEDQEESQQDSGQTEDSIEIEEYLEILFKDIENSIAAETINEYKKIGLIHGRSAEFFEPKGLITKAEALKITLGVLGYTLDSIDPELKTTFLDVYKEIWYYLYIAMGEDLDLADAYQDGTYGPNNFVSRISAVKLILDSAGIDISLSDPFDNPFEDLPDVNPYAAIVQTAEENGILEIYLDKDELNPDHYITREEFIQLSRFLK